MDFQQEFDEIFEAIKDTLPAGAEYLSYSIPSYSGHGSSGQSFFTITDGKPDHESIPDVLKSDRENRNNAINRRISDAEFKATIAQQPGHFVIFSISKENGYTYRIATPAELVHLTKLDLQKFLDPGTRKEIVAEVAAGKKGGEPDVVGHQKIYYENGDVKEYTGAPISDFARAAFHALDGQLKFVYAMVSETDVIIRTSPEIPGVTELYEANEDVTLDASRLENIYGFLESFSEAKIGKAIEALGTNPGFRAKAAARYGQFIKARVGKDAGIESFAKAALTRKEAELFSDWYFAENVISLSRRDREECQAVVDFIGSLVMSHLDIHEFRRQMEAADNETDMKMLYFAAAQKVRDGILGEAKVYGGGWFGKISEMLANHQVEKLLFEKTHFTLENSDALKAFIFYLAMNNRSAIYFDIFQSYVADLTEFFWFLPAVPRTAWGDTDLVLPATTLKFRRRAEYRLGDDGEWLRTSPKPQPTI